MPVLPPSNPAIPAQKVGGTCSLKTVDIIKQAMLEISVIDPNENPSGPESANGLIKLNRMLDSWNADGRYVYASKFQIFTLLTNAQPISIGPSGDWQVDQRPTQILSANTILNAGAAPYQPPTPTEVRQPIYVRDADWWANKRAFSVNATFPTDVYYQPDWPNGNLFFWPIPNTAYPVELETWGLLSQLQLSTAFCMPPGYMDAVVYSLAISLAPSFSVQPSPTLGVLASKAIQRIQSLNVAAPRIGTRDAGIPNGTQNRTSFNYLTGSIDR